MQEQQAVKQNPLLRIWGWGKDEHGRLICAVLGAFIGVALGMLPYFAAAQVIIKMLAGERELSLYLPWLGLGLLGYAARTFFYNMALSISHKATFSILKTIRQKILAKLPKLPLGTVMDMSSGKMKQIIVDQVDGMETTLAHLFPEMTANVAAPILILVYLFVLDWRMALLSIVTIPVGMAFMMSVMGNYSRDYEGAVKVTQEMNGTIVEYINGIEVIKAFNQGKSSYAKFADRVRANASYFYNWMKRCQWQKYYENGEYLWSAEMTEEQNYNMIDGRMNNISSAKQSKQTGKGRTSVLEKLHRKQKEIAIRSGKRQPEQVMGADMERNRK